jgi:hypothetical protein
MGYLKTPAAARALKTTYHKLMGLIRFDKIAPPQRDSSGDFIWTDDDLERARRALAPSRVRAAEVVRG